MINDIFLPNFPDDCEALERALRGSMNGSDCNVASYEMAVKSYFDADFCVAIQSCTTALIAAMKAVGVRDGDAVAMPPTAPLCTVNAVLAAAAIPKFVDTEESGFGLSLVAVKEALRTRKLAAVIEVPMFGYPTRIDKLGALLKNHAVPLIADLAHCHGTILHSNPISAFAIVSCFSTHERKVLSTGEGGFILTNDESITAACRSFRQNGYLTGRHTGINAKLCALQAELGRSRLGHLDQQLALRRANLASLCRCVVSDVVRPLMVVPGGNPNGYSAVMEIRPTAAHDFLSHQLKSGIPSDVARYGIKCLFEYPALMRFREECPNAASLLKRITTFPTHPGIGEAELRQMSHVISSFNRFNR